jgi:hypothetical protein
VRYHGILAPCASQRSQVVPVTPPGTGPVARDPEASAQGTAAVANSGRAPATADGPASREAERAKPSGSSPADASPRRTRWAALLQRVFDIDALRCPRCGSTLRLLAAIEDPCVPTGTPLRASSGAPTLSDPEHPRCPPRARTAP